MGKVQLTAEIDDELSTRVRLAAASSDQSESEWLEGLLTRELGGRREFRLGGTTISMPLWDRNREEAKTLPSFAARVVMYLTRS